MRPCSTWGLVRGAHGDKRATSFGYCWFLVLVVSLVSLTRGFSLVGPTSTTDDEYDLGNPCPGEPVDDSDSCNPNLCDEYATLIDILAAEIGRMRSASPGLAEKECMTMALTNGSLRTLSEGDLQCSNRSESDILAHKAVVSHQAYASVLSQPDASFPSFSSVKEQLKSLSCNLMCHCRSLNSTELQQFATSVWVNPPSQMSHKWLIGCVMLRSLEQTLIHIKSYLTDCH